MRMGYFRDWQRRHCTMLTNHTCFHYLFLAHDALGHRPNPLLVWRIWVAGAEAANCLGPLLGGVGRSATKLEGKREL
jgi:hypothetical protein